MPKIVKMPIGQNEDYRTKNRIWELDFLRGIALLLMVYFHIIFDMKEFYNYPVNYESGFNYFTGRAAFTLFTLLSAISCSLSRNNIKRGLKILSLALIITLSTHLYGPEFGIKFGVLHFIGTSILLYPLFSKANNYVLAFLGTVIIILGRIFQSITVPKDYLFIFGITSSSFVSSDYYPIFPYFGLFLYGIIIGKTLYNNKRSLFSFVPKDNIISRFGKYTLPIYMLHQPVIIAILKLIEIIVQGRR